METKKIVSIAIGYNNNGYDYKIIQSYELPDMSDVTYDNLTLMCIHFNNVNKKNPNISMNFCGNFYVVGIDYAGNFVYNFTTRQGVIDYQEAVQYLTFFNYEDE